MPRLIVVARPRSGSTAVMEILGSHPEIQNLGEPLNPVHCDLPTNEEEVYKYFDDKLSQKPAGWPRPWNAFKIHAYQKDVQKFRWDNLMHYCGVEAAIVVWRKEIVESIVSTKIAQLTGKWYSNKECNTITSVNISKDHLEWRIQEDFKNWSDLFEQWPIEMRPIFIQYEDLFYSNDNKTIPEHFQTVFEQIGIDRCDYVKCHAKRQNPAPLKEKVFHSLTLTRPLKEKNFVSEIELSKLVHKTWYTSGY
uniref:Sulfotransferase n=1 Tax=Acrobeloides nanus TaxID=290746 RepID=A0A914E1F1_9BILA